MSDFPVSLFTTVMYLRYPFHGARCCWQCAHCAMRCNAQDSNSHAVTSCNKFNLDELLGTCQASASALCPLVIWAGKPHTRSLAGSALFSRYSHMLLSLSVKERSSSQTERKAAVHKQKRTQSTNRNTPHTSHPAETLLRFREIGLLEIL